MGGLFEKSPPKPLQKLLDWVGQVECLQFRCIKYSDPSHEKIVCDLAEAFEPQLGYSGMCSLNFS